MIGTLLVHWEGRDMAISLPSSILAALFGAIEQQLIREEVDGNDDLDRSGPRTISLSTVQFREAGGAGSTGWLSSVFNIAIGVGAFAGVRVKRPPPMSWSARELRWVVREPFASLATGARMVAGRLGEGESLELESHMPTNGVIFSDGVEQDFLNFNSGAIAHIGRADVSAQLVVPSKMR